MLLAIRASQTAEKQFCIAVILVIGSIILLGLCFWMLKFSQKNIPTDSFQIESLESADGDAIPFLLVYLMPLFSDKLDSLHWSIWIPALILSGFIIGSGHGYHFNPLLRILGWHFYKVGTPEGVTYVLLTRQELRTKKTLKVARLTEYLMIEGLNP